MKLLLLMGLDFPIDWTETVRKSERKSWWRVPVREWKVVWQCECVCEKASVYGRCWTDFCVSETPLSSMWIRTHLRDCCVCPRFWPDLNMHVLERQSLPLSGNCYLFQLMPHVSLSAISTTVIYENLCPLLNSMWLVLHVVTRRWISDMATSHEPTNLLLCHQ